MADTVVPYARFLEIRQRRERVGAELTRQSVAATVSRPLAGERLGAQRRETASGLRGQWSMRETKPPANDPPAKGING